MLDCKQHVIEEYPKEACGVIIKGIYYKCGNVSEAPETSFIISPRDMADMLEIGEIDYIVHSHCNSEATLSISDSKIMGYFSADWIIYSCIEGKIVDKKIYDRTGKEI